jgi:hypothetical protein
MAFLVGPTVTISSPGPYLQAMCSYNRFCGRVVIFIKSDDEQKVPICQYMTGTKELRMRTTEMIWSFDKATDEPEYEIQSEKSPWSWMDCFTTCSNMSFAFCDPNVHQCGAKRILTTLIVVAGAWTGGKYADMLHSEPGSFTEKWYGLHCEWNAASA